MAETSGEPPYNITGDCLGPRRRQQWGWCHQGSSCLDRRCAIIATLCLTIPRRNKVGHKEDEGDHAANNQGKPPEPGSRGESKGARNPDGGGRLDPLDIRTAFENDRPGQEADALQNALDGTAEGRGVGERDVLRQQHIG